MITLTPRRLLTGTEQLAYPVIAIQDGIIAAIEAGEQRASACDTLTPTFFDIHVHGACTHDFMTAILPEIDEVGRFLASRGVGHYLATTVTAPLDLTFRALERLAGAVENSTHETPGSPIAAPVGIHLEGPFVSHAKRGVHPAACLLEPSVELFERMRQAARGHIRLLTLAPELPGAPELIAYATARGVKVSIGHSNATAAQTLAAIAAGATSSTHLFNAMRALDHREPGILGTILDRDEVYTEMICDGVHVDPALVRLWLKIKGPEKAILITDGMSATGMPNGTYMLGDFPVEVRDGVCLAGTTLAGSVLTMDRAVENVQRFTGTSLQVALRLASQNPARMLGLEPLSTVAVGQPANFNVYNPAGERTGQIFRGTPVSPARA